MSAQPTTLKRIATLVLFALLLMTVVAQAKLVLAHEGSFYKDSNVPVGADFLVFYTAGRIVSDGDGARLYDAERQSAEQFEILNRGRGLAIYPYPAFVAVPYSALAGIPLHHAFLLTAVVFTMTTLAALMLLAWVSPLIRNNLWLITAAVFVSHPFQPALLGGQTVAFTFLCLSAFYAGLRKKSDALAGIALGLLLYKPPAAALFVVLMIVWRQWRTLGWTGLTALVLYGIGTIGAGMWWPKSFTELVSSEFYRSLAIEVDGNKSISIPGLTQHLLGFGSPAAMAATLACVVLLVIPLLKNWRSITVESPEFPLILAMAIVVSLLSSPHALYYEAGLLVIPVLLLVESWQARSPIMSRGQLWLLVALFLAGFAWPLVAFVGFEPLVFPLIATACALAIELRRMRQSRPQTLAELPTLASYV